MDLGRPLRTLVVEPLEDPVPRAEPEPATEPELDPRREREPEPVAA